MKSIFAILVAALLIMGISVSANAGAYKDSLNHQHSLKTAAGEKSLILLAQGPVRIQMGPDNRRPLDGANSSRSANGLTLENLRNAEYRSKYYGDGPVRLNNGRHEMKIDPDSHMKAFIELTDKIAFGDLNGDRVDIKSIVIKSGVIVVDMLTHGPNDPQCCPTLRKTQRYRLDGGRLVRVQ